MNWFAPLTGVATGPGGCSSDWQSFTFWLSLIKNNDGNRSDVIYYGLLPRGDADRERHGLRAVRGQRRHGHRPDDDGARDRRTGRGGSTARAASPGPPWTGTIRRTSRTTPRTRRRRRSANTGSTSPTARSTRPRPTRTTCRTAGPAWISLYDHAQLCNNTAFNPRTASASRTWRPPDLVDPYLWPWEYIPDPPNWERHPGRSACEGGGADLHSRDRR